MVIFWHIYVFSMMPLSFGDYLFWGSWGQMGILTLHTYFHHLTCLKIFCILVTSWVHLPGSFSAFFFFVCLIISVIVNCFSLFIRLLYVWDGCSSPCFQSFRKIFQAALYLIQCFASNYRILFSLLCIQIDNLKYLCITFLSSTVNFIRIWMVTYLLNL